MAAARPPKKGASKTGKGGVGGKAANAAATGAKAGKGGVGGKAAKGAATGAGKKWVIALIAVVCVLVLVAVLWPKGDCRSDADCDQEAERCNPTTHMCELLPGHCRSKADCDQIEQCNPPTHMCELQPGRCRSITDCDQEIEYCDLPTHECVLLPGHCSESYECSPTPKTPVCNQKGVCVECVDSGKDCPPGQTCDPTTYTCQAATPTGPCDNYADFTAGTLVQGCLTPAPTAPPNAFPTPLPRPGVSPKKRCEDYATSTRVAVNGGLSEAYWSFLFIKVKDTKPGGRMYDLRGEAIIPTNTDQNRFFKWTGVTPNHCVGDYSAHGSLCTVEGDYTTIRVGRAGSSSSTPTLRGIKFESRQIFDQGIFVFAANHIPAGYSVWPAFWLTARESGDGDTWACNGEIDILEYANDAGQPQKGKNQITLHTNTKPGGTECTQLVHHSDGSSVKETCTKASDPGSRCGCKGAKAPCPNMGCARHTPGDRISSGAAFNAHGGGTYACQLTGEGKITVWFWAAHVGIPADILTNDFQPSTWDTPGVAKTVFDPCPGQFAKLRLVIDTKMCGDWAGSSFPN